MKTAHHVAFPDVVVKFKKIKDVFGHVLVYVQFPDETTTMSEKRFNELFVVNK